MSRVTVNDLQFARGPRPILRGITLEHRAGRILTFLGPSGCGKTTLLWLLAGLLKQIVERSPTKQPGRPSAWSFKTAGCGSIYRSGGILKQFCAGARSLATKSRSESGMRLSEAG